MNFFDSIGHPHIVNHLRASVDQDRVAHAQIFSGKNGHGTLPMALAYARYILCGTEKESSNLMLDKLSHPDLHFVFPVNTTGNVKKNAISSNFFKEWREFALNNSYGSLFQWLQNLGIENKQGIISVNEAQDILKKINLKSYEGGYKIIIIWMADRMNMETSNKLLKLIEEPPEKTVFILITEHKEQILQTISSRCQLLEFPPIGAQAISEALQNRKQIPLVEAEKIAHRCQGDYNNALGLIGGNANERKFEEWFITWVRAAFKARGNKTVINELIEWSENISSNNREVLKQFLNYCIEFFRQALLINYNSESLVYLAPETNNFSLKKFAPFIHGNNIISIFEALEDALYHIERNGNSKIILTDLSIKLTRFLHIKE